MTARTAVAAPEPDLREHCRQFHPRITLRGQTDARVARAHSGDHYHFGSATHHHGPNPGPQARPEGWRTGGGVVLIDRQGVLRGREALARATGRPLPADRTMKEAQMSPVVYVAVTFPDAEAAHAARISSVQVFSQRTAPAENPTVAVYRAAVNGTSELLYPPADAEWEEDE